MRRIALLLLMGLAVPTLAPLTASADGPCHDDADVTHEIPANPDGITGKFALPAVEEPEHLVLFMHGYGHKSDSWVTHMRRAADAGAIAITPDYRGTRVEGGFVRGWFVQEGAQDAIDLARGALALCPSIEKVYLYGVSMGGNSSGLAAAAGATRLDGATPLFDHWFAIEPAANVIETYMGASILAPVNAFAARAKADIEEEFGGTLADVPEAYVDGAVVSHLDEIAASGLAGAIVVHGFDDGLVPYNQGRELADGLRAHGLSTDFYSVLRRGDGDKGENTGLTEYALGPTGQYEEPLAGHGSERSDTHIVIQTGLSLLLELIGGDTMVAAMDREFLVDPERGIVPIP